MLWGVIADIHSNLEALDAAALPGLRAAARSGLSGEARTRVTMLLAREPRLLMRLERAIAILARLDRPRCLQVLQTLAKRDPGAPETKLAEAGLKALLRPADAGRPTTQPAGR